MATLKTVLIGGIVLGLGAFGIIKKFAPRQVDKIVQARLNIDRINDTIVYDSWGRGKAFIGYRDGTQIHFSDYQEDQLARFDEAQAQAREQFVGAQEAEAEAVDTAVEDTGKVLYP